MLVFDVLLEAHRFVIERGSVKTTHKACIFENQFLLLLFASQIGERINNYTKNQIQHDNDDNEEEQQIIDYTWHEESFLATGRTQNITNTTAIAKPLIERRDDTHNHRITATFFHFFATISLRCWISAELVVRPSTFGKHLTSPRVSAGN